MTLQDVAALAVAVADLKEVQSVVRAMRAADAQALAGVCGPFGPAASFECRKVLHPEPRYEPRPVIHPTPRYEPRPVIHPQPRVEFEAARCPEPTVQTVVVHAPPNEQPMQPPWKTVPWDRPLQASPKVKVTRCHPDIIHKGMLLDFFI